MADSAADQKQQPIPETLGPVEDQKVNTRHVDVAAAYLNNAEQYDPLTPEEEKKVMRKTDWILLPMVRELTEPLL